MPLQVRADQLVRFAGLRHGGFRFVSVGNQPHDVQGFCIYFRCTRRTAFATRCPANGRSEERRVGRGCSSRGWGWKVKTKRAAGRWSRKDKREGGQRGRTADGS